MFNSDFQALWGVDTHNQGVISRDDLRYISNAGFNLLHIYDWNPVLRNHIPFLDYAYELGLGVLVPFSNYFITESYGDNDVLVSEALKSVSIGNNRIHPAIIGWIVANEYDATPSTTPIAAVVDLLVKIARLDPDPECNRFFTIPTTTQSGYSGEDSPGLGQISEIREHILKVAPHIYYNRYVNGLNPFMPFLNGIALLILKPYIDLYDSWGENPRPLLFTETGLSQKNKDVTGRYKNKDATLGETGMSDLEAEIIVGFLQVMRRTPQAQNFLNITRANVIGYCFFEYQQEAWKGDGSIDMYYGLHVTGESLSPIEPQQVSPVIWDGYLPYAYNIVEKSHYPVDKIYPLKAWKTLASIQTNVDYFNIVSRNYYTSPSMIPFVSALEDYFRIGKFISDVASVVIDCNISDWDTPHCIPYHWHTCKGTTFQTRYIIQQANAYGQSCPTNLSSLNFCIAKDICISQENDITVMECGLIFLWFALAALPVYIYFTKIRPKDLRITSKEVKQGSYGAVPKPGQMS